MWFSAMLFLSACGADRGTVGVTTNPGLTGGGDSINNGEGYFINRSQRDWELDAIPKDTRRYYEWKPVTPQESSDLWRHS